MGRRWVIGGVGMGLMIVAASAGCSSPSTVEFTRADCELRSSNGHAEAVVFRSSFTVRSVENEQLIYLVRIYGRDQKPIRSRDGKYETERGIVGATKTVMALQLDQEFRNIEVAIPVMEMGLRQEHLPPVAEIGVYRLNGECLGRIVRRIPITEMEQVLPPLVIPKSPTTRPAVKRSAAPRQPNTTKQR